MTDGIRWQAVLENNRDYDGVFFYAVTSTGVFCRPSCVSRPPRPEHVRFFQTREEAAAAGFRPCKRCRPDLADYAPEREVVCRVKALLETCCADPAAVAEGLTGLGLSRHRVEALFRLETGRTIAAELEHFRLERAKVLLRQGTLPIAQVAFEAGFGSLSSFYRRFRAAAGCTPAQYRTEEDLT